MNMRIIKLEEKDLELISGGKLQAKVKERIEKSTFNTIGYRTGQAIFTLVGGGVGFAFGGTVRFKKTEHFDHQTPATRTGYSTTKEFQVNPALGCGGAVIGALVGMKIWDELANKVF